MIHLPEKFIHWGSPRFELGNFDCIMNRSEPSVKPNGGLWASPVEDDILSWADWCRDADFHTDKLKSFFTFELQPTSRIYVVEGNKDLRHLYDRGYWHPHLPAFDTLEYKTFYEDMFCLNFERLTQDYDGIYVIMNHQTYWSMYGWDVTSLLIFNPKCMQLGYLGNGEK